MEICRDHVRYILLVGHIHRIVFSESQRCITSQRVIATIVFKMKCVMLVIAFRKKKEGFRNAKQK
jgi:hypothetical protein